MYIKNEFVPKNMFQFMMYFRLKYNMPMKELIDICIEKNHQAITSPKTSIYTTWSHKTMKDNGL